MGTAGTGPWGQGLQRQKLWARGSTGGGGCGVSLCWLMGGGKYIFTWLAQPRLRCAAVCPAIPEPPPAPQLPPTCCCMRRWCRRRRTSRTGRCTCCTVLPRRTASPARPAWPTGPTGTAACSASPPRSTTTAGPTSAPRPAATPGSGTSATGACRERPGLGLRAAGGRWCCWWAGGGWFQDHVIFPSFGSAVLGLGVLGGKDRAAGCAGAEPPLAGATWLGPAVSHPRARLSSALASWCCDLRVGAVGTFPSTEGTGSWGTCLLLALWVSSAAASTSGPP